MTEIEWRAGAPWRMVTNLLASVFLVAATACSTFELERPRVFVEDIRPVGGSVLSQRFELVLRLQNPNDRALNVRGLDFALDLNGAPFAAGVSNQQLVIPRLGSAIMTVDASTSTLDLIQQVFRLSERPTLDYTLRGKVLVDETFTGSVPFEDGGRVTLGQPVS